MTKARYGVGTLANIQAFGREVKARRAREADELGMTVFEKGRYILSGDLPARFQDTTRLTRSNDDEQRV